MATNQQKLDGLANGTLIWQQQIPLKKGDPAFHNTVYSAEHLLYLAKYYAQQSNTRAARLEQAVAAQNATITNLVSALASVAKGEPFDQAKLIAGVTEAAREGARAGVEESIDSIDVTVNTKEQN